MNYVNSSDTAFTIDDFRLGTLWITSRKTKIFFLKAIAGY